MPTSSCHHRLVKSVYWPLTKPIVMSTDMIWLLLLLPTACLSSRSLSSPMFALLNMTSGSLTLGTVTETVCQCGDEDDDTSWSHWQIFACKHCCYWPYRNRSYLQTFFYHSLFSTVTFSLLNFWWSLLTDLHFNIWFAQTSISHKFDFLFHSA